MRVYKAGAAVRLSFAVLLCGALAASAEKARNTEILWDTYGVPHIFASSDQELFRAFGWAAMHDHGNLILKLYGQARGRAAEYWGPSYVASDRWVRTNGIPERAKRWYENQTPQFRIYVDAFTDGMNAYAGEHPDRLAPEVRTVLPLNPVDVLAHVQRVIYFTFVVNQSEVGRHLDKAAPRSTAWDGTLTHLLKLQMLAFTKRYLPPPRLQPPPEPQGGDQIEGIAVPGSNAWAISPARTASGKAMLLANPHLPWSDSYLFYESQLSSPTGDSYGATLIGFPVQGIAFNANLGWTHTVNTTDGADLYQLTEVDAGYRWDDRTRAFEVESQSLKIKQPDGTLREESLTIRRSVHGPVVGTKDGKPVALRVAGLDEPGLCEEWWDMTRARNLQDFEKVLRRLQLPMFTVIYADRSGHILHLFNARVPVRPPGNYNWAGIVPGDTAATLWTRTHTYDELPRVLDPSSGWLQNSNDPPWNTTLPSPLDAAKYPNYLAPRSMGLRAQRSAKMLASEPQMTFEHLVEYRFSTRMELADRMLDDLLAAARTRGGERMQRAISTLAEWDHSADSSSRGAELFAAFVAKWWLSGPTRFSTTWRESEPVTTPRGLADPPKAAAILDAAAEDLETRFGSSAVTWGQAHRLRRDGLDLPGNGGTGDPLGIFHVVEYRPAKDGISEAVGGESFSFAVEFGNPLRAMALLSYGNSSQPGLLHRTEQLSLLSRKQLRPVWRTRKEIEAHLAERASLLH